MQKTSLFLFLFLLVSCLPVVGQSTQPTEWQAQWIASDIYAHGRSAQGDALLAKNQAELAMPLYYGLIDEKQTHRVADRLAEKVISDGYKVKSLSSPHS